MSDHNNATSTDLAPTIGSDLTPLAPANPLVSRGMADLANLPTTAEPTSSLKLQKLADSLMQLSVAHAQSVQRSKNLSVHVARINAAHPRIKQRRQALDQRQTEETIEGVTASEVPSQSPALDHSQGVLRDQAAASQPEELDPEEV